MHLFNRLHIHLWMDGAIFRSVIIGCCCVVYIDFLSIFTAACVVQCPLLWLFTLLVKCLSTHKIHHKWKQTLLSSHNKCMSKHWLGFVRMYRLLLCEFWRDRINQELVFPYIHGHAHSRFLFLSIFLFYPFFSLSLFSANSSYLSFASFGVFNSVCYVVKLYGYACVLCTMWTSHVSFAFFISLLSARTPN